MKAHTVRVVINLWRFTVRLETDLLDCDVRFERWGAVVKRLEREVVGYYKQCKP